jgi:hypothetical protein
LKALAHKAGVADPRVRWKLRHEPSFDNQIATLEWHEHAATMRLERAAGGGAHEPGLTLTTEQRLVDR